ncbi:MAG: cell division protein FtsA [Endomicrobium sp.]|jgi:cell division protein FtsA|nr:cell division protein FtsA [Endomicrobium sp.]
MVKESLVAGIDVGSNQICCVVGALDEEHKLVKILSGAVAPCPDGIKSGVVIDIGEASKAMHRAFSEAGRNIDGQIDNIAVAVRGNFIEAHNCKGVASIPDKEVDESIVEEALGAAQDSIRLDTGKEVLQIVPREFLLDQTSVQNPLRMEGNIIEIEALALVASTTNLTNILKALNGSNINCEERLYGYMVANDILLRKEEKESGCLLIDFGGSTTGIVHYEDSVLKYVYELPVGSDNITKDLMHKLRASYQEASRIKIEHGAAFCPDEFQNREFEYRAADGVTMMKTDRQEIVEQVIKPRLDQILYHIEETVKKKSPQGVPGSIILTGGGSKLEYITTAFEKYFEDYRPFVRIGFPLESKIIGAQEVISDSVYTCAIGAIHSIFSNPYYSTSPQKNSLSGGFNGIINWFKEIF